MTVALSRDVWLTTGQAAEVIGVSRSTMVRMLDAGRLPSDQPNKHRRVRLEDLLAYKESRRRGVMTALAATRAEVERTEPGATTADSVDATLARIRAAAGVER
ncbi:MAG: helix-turn-helix domain-containing protein [Propionibacteriaceae bacterium]|jgi:excisionase family DNA binding protein|nr:helix-turn-helix domain-containing protein [Propionibacteriaceae bacterium]